MLKIENQSREKSCKITNQNFYWRELQQGIYPKYFRKSSYVNSSMYIADAIFYGHDEILNDVDVIFSQGYGITGSSRVGIYLLKPLLSVNINFI